LLQLLWGQGCSNCCKNFLALLITCVFFVGIGVPSFFSSHVLPLGVVCFFCLGCFLVCVGMGSAWGVCWMGWDEDEEACWLVAFCCLYGCWGPKKIQYTPNDALSLFLVLDRFSRPVYVWGRCFRPHPLCWALYTDWGCECGNM
jgi:hypothetical protein